ncbi:hypothetical protein QN239_27415 [Mycolicibacterium sp. Y3]
MDKRRKRRHREAAGLGPLVSLPTGDQAFELVSDGPFWAAVRAQLFADAGDRDITPQDWDDILRSAQIVDTPEAVNLWAHALADVDRIAAKYRT